MWFAGLIRGAIAFALTFEIKETMPHREQIISTTLIVVLITTIVLGGLMSAFAKIVGLQAENTRTRKESVYERFSTKIEDEKDPGCWRRFDDRYIK